MTIGILGGGVWGSALAKLFSNQEVLIYTRDKKVMNSINDHHFNPKLKYAIFNDNVKACLLYTSPSPRDAIPSRMPSSA